MKNNSISTISKAILIIAALLLAASIFVPIWGIYLDAPQYPEGLRLQIWVNKITGDVDIINGLNHYIGMKTLHTDDFIEFTVLPYIVSAYVILFLITAYVGKRKLLYSALGAFILFGIVAMADFWKWEYDYGHHLDPNAAIKVPGMTYQPPLIGFKQLLNFGAYSIPDTGGWFFAGSGILLVIAVIFEVKKIRKAKVNATLMALFPCALLFASCSGNNPAPINYNKDACEYCKMTISESRFASELITSKGRVYKFDDLACMLKYAKENVNTKVKNYYVGSFSKEQKLIDATTAAFVKDEKLRSPMRGNIAAFSSKENAVKYAEKNQLSTFSWNDLSN